MRKKKRKKHTKIITKIVLFSGILIGGGIGIVTIMNCNVPEKRLMEYMKYIEKGEYEQMYAMLDQKKSSMNSKEEFIERNSKIYEGIEMSDLSITDITAKRKENGNAAVSYTTNMQTAAGNVEFTNDAVFSHDWTGYHLIWQDQLIFPELSATDKVQVTSEEAKRGDILDRNGRQLAGEGTASSVGIVPGRMENREDTIKKLAEYLGIGADEIEDKLKAGWVKADSFVPVATIPKIQEVDLLTVNPDKTVLEEKEKQDTLLKIPGIMLSDVKVRTYYLKEAASHLVGYVQAVTAEDLQEHKGEGYRTNSVIGKTGLETLYEKELKGTDGCEICIVDANGNKKSVIAYEPRKDGEDIHTTIDGDLQSTLYEQFKEDRGCSVALNPYTGEVLALVSTPSYDNNDFVRGMDNSQWSALNENEDRPLYNRFRQTWCPGSTFKPVIAAIGLKVGAFTANDDFGNEGLAWQKDSSWGDYTVTTLHDYAPVILKNALIYSDNIYFAKAALKIGADQLMQSLNQIGFNQELPFDIKMSESQYSNMDKIETEIQLADSGYGQGQILVNPLHLASIYTAFLNDGNMIKPYLHADGGSTSGEIWIKDAFSPQIVSEVMEGLEGVVNNPEGTGYGACREDIRLAGKTGTAELKATKEDTSGTEIGWFTVFTTDRDTENPILLISMVENVKDIGGSGYVVEKDKAILDEYLGNE